MSAFVLHLDVGAGPLRVAVKDVVDLAGTPTTAGCRVVARSAGAAHRDAACLAGVRALVAEGGARVVGKTGCNELAFGVTGLNPFFASPVNPIDPLLVVGGSSSGSAAAVGAGEADVAIGTDTGGSIRIPAACCGVAGLKPTFGRVPTTGVWPLAPSLDTVGPLARDVAGLVQGMALLDPTFAPPGVRPAAVLGRVRLPADATVDRALDEALAAAELPVLDVELPDFAVAHEAAMAVLLAEAWVTDAHLHATGGLSPEVAERLALGAAVPPERVAAARATGRSFGGDALGVLASLAPRGLEGAPGVLAMPTLAELPPRVADAGRVTAIRHTLPWNLTGWPALALPVPVPGGGVPASLQLVAPPGGDELLCATAAVIEAAVHR